MKDIVLVELFSGIGSQLKALKNINQEPSIVHTCDWNIHAIVAYDAIHYKTNIEKEFEIMNSKELTDCLSQYSISNDGKVPMLKSSIKSLNDETKKRILSAIKRTNNHVNISTLSAANLPQKIDILTYSFPCQDISNVGSFHGYNKGIKRDAANRSCLLWQVERILQEQKTQKSSFPKFLLLENVTALLSKRHKDDFNEWLKVLEEFGYHNHYYKLNAKDFGLPQNRHRLIMISTFIGTGVRTKKRLTSKLNMYFDEHNLNNKEYVKSLCIKGEYLKDILCQNYNIKKILLEALEAQANDTPSRRAIWSNNPKLVDNEGNVLDYVSTITTKQDRNPNSGNIYFDPQNGKSKYRFLTPRECTMLMGFTNANFEKIINSQFIKFANHKFFSRDILYHLAGNSIAVKVLEQVFKQVIEIKQKILNK